MCGKSRTGLWPGSDRKRRLAEKPRRQWAGGVKGWADKRISCIPFPGTNTNPFRRLSPENSCLYSVYRPPYIPTRMVNTTLCRHHQHIPDGWRLGADTIARIVGYANIRKNYIRFTSRQKLWEQLLQLPHGRFIACFSSLCDSVPIPRGFLFFYTFRLSF